MQEKDPTLTLILDEICGPSRWRSRDPGPGFLRIRICACRHSVRIGQRLNQRFRLVLQHQVVNHIVLELRLLD